MESTHESDRYVIEFISATDIPWVENKVKSDPFIQAYISTHVERLDSFNVPVSKLERIGNTVTTPRRLDCSSVVWHCYRDFNTKPTAESILTVEIYHQSSLLLGKVDIPTRVFSHENPMTFPFYTAKVRTFSCQLTALCLPLVPFYSQGPQAQNPNFSVTLRRVFINEAPPLYRTFFVIRHGESKWNEAQEKIHIAGMLNKDHPLTEDGINQALTLNARWKLATGSHGGLSKGVGSDSQIIDCGRLNEEDLRPVEAGEDDGDSDGEGGSGPSSSGASNGRGKGLTKLYDSIFQKHSSVTAAGKARDAKPAEPVTPKGKMFIVLIV